MIAYVSTNIHYDFIMTLKIKNTGGYMYVVYAQNSCHKHYIFGKDSKPQSDAIVCYKITSYYVI